MDHLIEALACMAAAACFGTLLRQPKGTLLYTAVIGMVGYVVFQLVGDLPGFFISGLCVGLLCEMAARLARKTTTLFLISSIIPTVPGLGMYRSMMALSQHNQEAALSIALSTVAGIGAIALALTISTAFFGFITSRVSNWNRHQT